MSVKVRGERTPVQPLLRLESQTKPQLDVFSWTTSGP